MHDKKFVSIPKGEDPYTITPNRAVELIHAKREADANRLIKSFPENAEIQVLNGRFGPYIKAGKKNVKIPKGKLPEELTLQECVTLAENAPEPRGRFGRFAKKKEAPEAPAKAIKKGSTKKTAPKKADVKKAVPVKAAAKKAVVKKAPVKKVAAKKVKKK